MNMVEYKRALTEKNIFNLVPEYKIFETYLGYGFVLGQVFLSPLRIEAHPSFNIFRSTLGTNTLMYKDYATGDSGNCFKFIARKFELSYYEAMVKVNDDFDLNLNIRLIEVYDPKTKTRKSVELFTDETTQPLQKSKQPAIFVPVFRDWNTIDDLYWHKRYGITIETLEYFNVKPCEVVYVNDSAVWCHKSSNPIYCYGYRDLNTGEYVMKFYRPLEKNKKYKWMNNLNQASHSIIEGYDQIAGDKKKRLGFITKSLKDVICLRTLGFPAIAPKSESERITTDFLLKADELFEEKIVLFDNDNVGIARAAMLTNETGWHSITIPLEYRKKDISDFVEVYKHDKAKQLIKSLL